MHVIQTPVRFTPDIGGVESYVHNVSKTLVEQGHEVTVLCANSADYEPAATIDGITVERLSSPFSVANTNVTPKLPLALHRWADWADVIHTHLPTPWSADVSALVGELTDTPTVLTYHNDIVGDGIAGHIANLYNATGFRLTRSLVDRVLVTREAYIHNSAHLSPADPIDVVRNGVDTERFAPTPVSDAKRRRLGFVPERQNLFFLSVLDEYHEYKGFSVLLDAIDQLAADGVAPHLLVGGDGPMRQTYERQVRARGLDEHITFAGYIPDSELVATYNGADAFVMPSTSSEQEGFGLAALEALSCETPVVTTAVVGVAPAIDQESAGVTVDRRDPYALASGIRSLLAQNLAACGRRGRRLCEREYQWVASVEKLVGIYQELLADADPAELVRVTR